MFNPTRTVTRRAGVSETAGLTERMFDPLSMLPIGGSLGVAPAQSPGSDRPDGNFRASNPAQVWTNRVPVAEMRKPRPRPGPLGG